MFKRRKNAGIVATGAAMAAISLVGVFAAISDTADTGLFRVESADKAASVELKIGDDPATDATTDCAGRADYVDNQTPIQLDASDISEGNTFSRFICLKNEGAQTAFLDISMFGVTNTDGACTGDEADFDATCGSGEGELADDIKVDVKKHGASALTDVRCNKTVTTNNVTYTGLADDTTPRKLGAFPSRDQIGAGEFACYEVVVTYDAVTDNEEQANQSDEASWKFQFLGDLTS